MSKARNISNIFSGTTDAATDAEVVAAIASHNTSANGHVKRGGTASRPESPTIGDIYYNTELRDLEQYTEDGWMLVAKQPPRIPTIGSASLDGSNNASVSFTPSAYGQPATSYTVQSNPGSFTATGSSSPISISGSNLELDTSYTFRVKATGTYGDSEYTGYTGSVTPISLGSYESIASTTLSSGSQASITFSSIPSTYTHLQIRGIARTTGAGTGHGALRLTVNSDTGSNYSSHQLLGDGATTNSQNFTSGTYSWAGGVANNTSSTASAFSATIIDILDYANTNKYKTIRTFSGVDLNNTNGGIYLISGLWMSTSAITSVTLQILTSAGYDLAQYSSLALYGIKAGA